MANILQARVTEMDPKAIANAMWALAKLWYTPGKACIQVGSVLLLPQCVLLLLLHCVLLLLLQGRSWHQLCTPLHMGLGPHDVPHPLIHVFTHPLISTSISI